MNYEVTEGNSNQARGSKGLLSSFLARLIKWWNGGQGKDRLVITFRNQTIKNLDIAGKVLKNNESLSLYQRLTSRVITIGAGDREQKLLINKSSFIKRSLKLGISESKFYLSRTFSPERTKLKTEEVDGRTLAIGGMETDSSGVEKVESIPIDIVFDVAGKHSKFREGKSCSTGCHRTSSSHCSQLFRKRRLRILSP